MTSIPHPRQYDIVLFGASGFVGRLVAGYLASHAPTTTKVALAGRNRSKLLATRQTLPPHGAQWPIVEADATDHAALETLARSTAVVATTVGPFARDGFPLASACATAGTHYADLTGELLFVRRCIDHLHGPAQDSGARIVHACGYDSIPSDLAVALVHQQVQADNAGQLAEAVLVARGRGGISGGTIDSLRLQLHAVAAEPALRQVLQDPYALSPDRAGEADLGSQPDVFRPYLDPLAGGWIAPFAMAPFNTRIVRRSNALTGWAYGHDLRYREAMGGRGGATGALQAATLAAAQAAAITAMSTAPLSPLVDRILPKPGQGPSERVRRTGSFTSTVTARTTTGARYRAVVAAQADPGYGATAVMLGEAALCLALDAEQLPSTSGILTPAVAMGTVLADRLRHAGFTLQVTAC